MAITLVGTPAGGGSTTGSVTLTLTGTEGNLQVVYLVHRTGATTPSAPTGTGWSTVQLTETLITDTSHRRAIAMWWRTVPAAAGTDVTVSWGVSTTTAAFGYEFSTNTAGGAWQFASPVAVTDSGTTAVNTLASGSKTPANNEAVVVAAHVTRGYIGGWDTYTDSFVRGDVVAASGTGSTDVQCFTGHKIVDAAPVSQSTTCEWSGSAVTRTATSQLAAFSVDAGLSGTAAPTEQDDTSAASGTVVHPTQFVRPTATMFAGDWTAVGAATLHEAVDEETATFDDHIRPADDPVDSPVVLRLEPLPEPSGVVADDEVTVHIQYDKEGTAAVNGVFELRQGYVSEASPGTLIASTTDADVTDAAEDVTISLTAVEYGTIVFTTGTAADLDVRIVADLT